MTILQSSTNRLTVQRVTKLNMWPCNVLPFISMDYKLPGAIVKSSVPVKIKEGLDIFESSSQMPFQLVALQLSVALDCCTTVLREILANKSFASGMFSRDSECSLIHAGKLAREEASTSFPLKVSILIFASHCNICFQRCCLCICYLLLATILSLTCHYSLSSSSFNQNLDLNQQVLLARHSFPEPLRRQVLDD